MPHKDPEARRAYNKARYEAERERFLAESRERYRRPGVKERVAAYNRARRTIDPDADRARGKAWREANADKVKANNAKWVCENPERHRAHLLAFRERRRALVMAKKSSGCVDCGNMDVRVIQLHAPNGHSPTAPRRIKGSHKRRVIGDGGGWSLAALQAELAICVALCANCHLIRHSTEEGRLGNWPTSPPPPQQETLW